MPVVFMNTFKWEPESQRPFDIKSTFSNGLTKHTNSQN